MSIPPTDALRELPFVAVQAHPASLQPSEIECEVIGHFDQFRSPLLRYVLSLGLTIHDAEEIIQEVFLALFRHLHSGKSRRNLRGWIFSVAHNLALKLRQANRRSWDAATSNETLARIQIDPAPNPEEQLLSTQRQKRLLTVLSAMPEQDQCCLRLRAEGLRYREIAQVLGISLGSVSVTLTRSLARLMRLDEV
ncbi:MAG TPA: sigma-70 family RNA polymerase sigma factor [Terriglobales bacterium]|nr:sigma-70 family RNA polymerase sigma factor [Terriglobales bacterium]